MPVFRPPSVFCPKVVWKYIAVSLIPLTKPISFYHLFPNLTKANVEQNKSSTTSSSSFPFTVALGDPFVCVVLLPCIGWTVNHSHLVVVMLDVQRQELTAVCFFTNILFFIHLFSQVLHPSTDPGLLLWTLSFSLSPLSLMPSPLPTRDPKNLTNQRRRLPIWLLEERKLERNSITLITNQMLVLPANQTKSPKDQ